MIFEREGGVLPIRKTPSDADWENILALLSHPDFPYDSDYSDCRHDFVETSAPSRNKAAMPKRKRISSCQGNDLLTPRTSPVQNKQTKINS